MTNKETDVRKTIHNASHWRMLMRSSNNAILPRKITDTVAKEQNEERDCGARHDRVNHIFASILSNGKRFFFKRGELDFEFSMQNFLYILF